MATATTEKTGIPDELVTLVAASASNLELTFYNRSGAPVELFVNDQTVPYFELPASPPDKAFLNIAGTSMAASKWQGRCRDAKLIVNVTNTQ